MGCTPSIHVNQSGVVHCSQDDDSNGNSQLIGVQGNFRATCDGGEGTSRDVFQDSIFPNDLSPYEEELFKGSVFFQNQDAQERQKRWAEVACASAKEEAVLKFGSMCLQIPTIRALLVFSKDDAQSDALKWAAEKLFCECTMVYTPEDATESYQNLHHHLIFIDSRQSKTLDYTALCRTIHSIQGSQYSCLVAVVKKSAVDKEDGSIVSFLRSGFTRWFVENHNLGVCLNELIQIHHTDISYLLKLRASQALFSALDSCREGIIVTNVDHSIQYANKASEKLLGYTAEDLCGKDAQTLCRAESVKADIPESINMQVKKGKDWEGTLFHKRKSGENLPLWSRIQPVEIYSEQAEHLIHVNEFPFNERPFSTETAGLNRRQSFAKFHPMTLEPPITKVINMILATQEHSPLFVVQALDRVLDILRSTDIYSPQFTGLRQNQADDQVASDLFSGLISNSKQVIRRFSHEAFKATKCVLGVPSCGTSNTQTTPPPLTPSTVPTLANAPPRVKELLEIVHEWHYDVFEIERVTEKRPLLWVGMAVFASFNSCNILSCDESVLRNWLTLMESNYHPNPYHNSTHAADVLQATAYFLKKPRLKAIFDPIDEIVSLVAAVIHDVDHPGRNSAFLCNTGSELAILYNDLSVLESHHSALAFRLTIGNETANIFHNVNKDSYKEMRRSIIDMVLATEMTKHFEHLSKFVNVFTKSVEAEEDESLEPASPDLSAMSTPENIVLVKRILIKCADVSNPARPLNSCKEWASRIAEEYMSQTDEEKSKGLPIVMPAFDRTKCSIPKSQMGFTDYFVNDMFDAWDAFCDVPELMENIKTNYEYWKEQEALRHKSSGAQESTSNT
ncbi:high affinity cAMP-specific and IBMX-insensitive 3',5'-cyclic phosphodiesterase 8B-like isoform X4 [Argiope bruennichi]|uniref:high affinity cAMP-specific and IBMX-insensitive 3',5'-cyclic phosphodiesterase 8B-like isoform X4 n=1 Tax=Argiope bruennichi TaxID=94029 RepID=UPI002494F8A6|nr:high affinity cAMP-specific and IBMX-insensitive 3',5'-cyclic phosphodiesterase 8B-like isoform X4 [Argiope bruennichi]